MSLRYTFFLLLLFCFSCTVERENIASGNKDVVSPMIGTYTFDLTVKNGLLDPNIDSYVPPKEFTTEILKSEFEKEISIMNIHGLGQCVYALVSGTSFNIPLQDLGLQEEDFGFDIVPDFPDKMVSIKGNGLLVEIPRTATEPIDWEMIIEYQIIYDGVPLWEITGSAGREPVSGSTNYTCD
jgi:hypothetical protein